MPAAIFTIDRTLFPGDLGEVFDDFALRTGVLKGLRAAKLRAARAAGATGLGPAARARRVASVTAFKGVTGGVFNQAARDCFAEHVRPALRADAQDRIRQHQAQGDEIVLATWAPQFVANPVRAFFDAHALVALRESTFGPTINGFYEPVPVGRGKVDLCRALLEKLELHLANATVYSGEESDVPLLEAAKTAVVVNAEGALASRTTAGGWESVSWSAPIPADA